MPPKREKIKFAKKKTDKQLNRKDKSKKMSRIKNIIYSDSSESENDTEKNKKSSREGWADHNEIADHEDANLLNKRVDNFFVFLSHRHNLIKNY